MTPPVRRTPSRARRLRLALLFSMAVPLAGFLSLIAPASAQPRVQSTAPAVIGVVSGGVDGTYIRIAADLAAVLDGPQLRVVPIIGKGSVQNIDDILHLRGTDIGIVQSDVLAYLRTHPVVLGAARAIGYIAKLYDEEVHILARPGIASLNDLAGRAVNVDGAGSGTALTASILFESLGLAVQVRNDDQATALGKLRRGEIDALVYVAGKPARLFTTLPTDTGLHLLPIPMTSALIQAYVPSRLDHADYPALLADDASVETVAVGAVLAVFLWPRNSDRYRTVARFVDAFFNSFAQFRQPPRHPKWREVNLEAQVPGWTRFPAAAEWLQRRADTPTPQR